MHSYSAQTAQGQMFCLSPRFSEGTSRSAEYKLNLTGLNSGINGELFPVFGLSYTHGSYIEVYDDFIGDAYPGSMLINIPTTDANGNGLPDFFESSQAVSTITSGTYNINQLSSGAIQATWARAAGSTSGGCTLKFIQNQFFTFAIFDHSFDLIEYTGAVAYVTSPTNVNGTINFSQTGTPDNILQGPVQFVKTATNRFNELTIQPGTWTNNFAQNLEFMEDVYTRSTSNPNLYAGYFDFVDWDPNTFDPDYYVWILAITDTHDTDRDGIPDFSDDAGNPLPRAPQLALSTTSSNLLLTIRGDVGRVHRVLEAASLTAPTWTTNSSVTLTSDPQIIALPLAGSGMKFWRVSAE